MTYIENTDALNSNAQDIQDLNLDTNELYEDKKQDGKCNAFSLRK